MQRIFTGNYSQKLGGVRRMLGDSPIHPVLLSTDLAATRDFYHEQLGPEILSENEAAIVFRCGGGTQLSAQPARPAPPTRRLRHRGT